MPDGGARFFNLMNDVGLTRDRITVRWDSAHPGRIDRKAELKRAVDQATEHHVDIAFSVYPSRAGSLSTARAKTQFATFLKILAAAYPSVTTYVVANEFNLTRFYRPQFSKSCKSVSAANYIRLLARSYDALKAIDRSINVISSVSPRGNDDCKARSNISISPVRFIRDMGRAYTALGRDRPLFDHFGIHLYPSQPTNSIAKGYQWPNIGTGNLDRLKQALWDAFWGTDQPVPDWQPAGFRFTRSLDSLKPAKIWIGEVGWQVRARKGHHGPYHGRENVHVTTEARQARIYAELVRMMDCDPLVEGMNFFGLVDEPDLDRFQAGLLRADWTKRPSYRAVKAAVARAKAGCQGAPVQWQHTEGVVGARVQFQHQALGFRATAREDASYSAGVFPVGARTTSAAGHEAIERALAGGHGAKFELRRRGTMKAYWSQTVRFPAQALTRGTYVSAIRISAAMNPDRTRVFVSRPFQVGNARR
jgi:hypothetical protein